MRLFLKLFALAALVALLPACASKTRIVNEHGAYKAYLETQKQLDNNWATAVKAVVDSADQCEDDTCRTARSAMAAMALMSRPGGTAAGVQPFRHEPTTGEKVLLSLTGQAGQLVGTAVNGYVAIKQSDNQAAVSINDSDNRTALAVGGFNALRDVGVAQASRPTYSYTVGGNLGDTYGDHYTGGDRTEIDTRLGAGAVLGDGNLVANGDQNFNEGRIGDEYTDRSIGSCDAGNGGAGAAGATGTGGAGTGAAGGPGTGGPGGNGAPGGNAGNCSTGGGRP